MILIFAITWLRASSWICQRLLGCTQTRDLEASVAVGTLMNANMYYPRNLMQYDLCYIIRGKPQCSPSMSSARWNLLRRPPSLESRYLCLMTGGSAHVIVNTPGSAIGQSTLKSFRMA